MSRIYKYPRTQHIQGSDLQPGDEDLKIVPFRTLKNHYLVIEEKMDGANCGISFNSQGQLLLQSRGHFLTGGANERQFHLFKSWANRYAGELWEILQDRYVMYGEWLYAKHTIFYTDLPHYFMEFDILDTHTGEFLSTDKRIKRLKDYPFICSVKVLYEGKAPSFSFLQKLVGPSHFISENLIQSLNQAAQKQGLNPERVLHETDLTGLMEGLYIKVEEDGIVKGRFKYVRSSFLQTILDSNSHWMERPILPNRLKEGVMLF